MVGKYTYLFLHPLWVPEGSISDLRPVRLVRAVLSNLLLLVKTWVNCDTLRMFCRILMHGNSTMCNSLVWFATFTKVASWEFCDGACNVLGYVCQESSQRHKTIRPVLERNATR